MGTTARSRCALAVLISTLAGVGPVAATTAAPGPTATPCPPCHQIGFLEIGAPTIDPPHPRVGDQLTLSFPVAYQVAGGLQCDGSGFGDSCALFGGTLYLEGTSSGVLDRAAGVIVVQRRVLQAGTASVGLSINALTEDQCYHDSGAGSCSFYFRWSYISAVSDPHDILLLDSGAPIPSPTPTSTATPPPLQTGPPVGDCHDDGAVTVDELLTLIAIALGDTDPSSCAAGDRDHDGEITVDEIVAAIDSALRSHA